MTDTSVLFEEAVQPGASWSHVLKRGTALRITDTDGGANAGAQIIYENDNLSPGTHTIEIDAYGRNGGGTNVDAFQYHTNWATVNDDNASITYTNGANNWAANGSRSPTPSALSRSPCGDTTRGAATRSDASTPFTRARLAASNGAVMSVIENNGEVTIPNDKAEPLLTKQEITIVALFAGGIIALVLARLALG